MHTHSLLTVMHPPTLGLAPTGSLSNGMSSPLLHPLPQTVTLSNAFPFPPSLAPTDSLSNAIPFPPSLAPIDSLSNSIPFPPSLAPIDSLSNAIPFPPSLAPTDSLSNGVLFPFPPPPPPPRPPPPHPLPLQTAWLMVCQPPPPLPPLGDSLSNGMCPPHPTPAPMSLLLPQTVRAMPQTDILNNGTPHRQLEQWCPLLPPPPPIIPCPQCSQTAWAMVCWAVILKLTMQSWYSFHQFEINHC